MNVRSIITINEKAVENNISFLRKKLGPTVKISSVVKANAYGHGIETIVPLFEKNGIDHFAVFEYLDAIRVLNSLSAPKDIMIMGWISKNDIQNVITKGFEFYIFNIERLQNALYHAKKLNIKAKIHIEVETGMNRTGLNNKDLKEAITLINDNKRHVEITGFCTHLAGAESISNYIRIQKQLKKYQKLLDYVRSCDIIPKYAHVANSAAAFVFPKSRMDLVRVGIMQYGFWSSAETFIHYINSKKIKTDPLNRVLDWKSQVMSVKEVKTGEYIGYGISYLAQKDVVTALVPVGYFNGYNRSLSNKGRVIIRGHRCGVIGVVNMNMTIVDVTEVPEVTVGDEVIIIGKQGDMEIKVSDFGDISNKLNYEVLTHLPASIKREIIKQ